MSKNISEPDHLLNSFAEKGHIDISCINKAALIAKLHRCKDKKGGIAKTNYEQEFFLIPLQTFSSPPMGKFTQNELSSYQYVCKSLATEPAVVKTQSALEIETLRKEENLKFKKTEEKFQKEISSVKRKHIEQEKNEIKRFKAGFVRLSSKLTKISKENDVVQQRLAANI